LLAVAPDLIGFGQAKVAKWALVLAFGSAALAALTGAGFPAAMVCPELSPPSVGRDVLEKPVPALTIPHNSPAKSFAISAQRATFYIMRQKVAYIESKLRRYDASSQGTKKWQSWKSWN
jgi:hypothetical protein